MKEERRGYHNRLTLTGSLRVAFLLPSMLAGLGTMLLVYDLARRLWSRETGFIAAVALLFSVQFVWQARQAQIDATLCFWTTLSLYGLLRHLLLGPAWKWYLVGWLAAGLGVITKGVGFLPLLILIPFLLLRSQRWSPRYRGEHYAKWWLGPLAMLLAIGAWLVPVLAMSLDDRELASYRDEILFHQTITRYANAWHHHEPFWYFIVDVIPWLWLPLTALLPWLIPKWRDAWRSGDLRIVLPLIWKNITKPFRAAAHAAGVVPATFGPDGLVVLSPEDAARVKADFVASGGPDDGDVVLWGGGVLPKEVKEYEAAGYDMPTMIFWNLAAGDKGVPVKADEPGTALVSGYSQGQMKVFLDGGGFDEAEDEEDEVVIDKEGNEVKVKAEKKGINPVAVMRKAISHEAYAMLRVVD